MRSYVHHSSATRSTSPRRTASRSLPVSSRTHTPTRTRAEHAEIARASAAWEREVAQGLQAFIGQTIPLDAHERLAVTHVLNLAEDETFAGWYNWRGITNPDMVLLGVLVGGPDNDATAAIAVDAKLSARSTKTQVLTQTLAQLLEPFQPLTNLVDALLGPGASERLVLRNGFHVVRGVATTIGTAAKSTRALLDPEYAAEFVASQPVSLRPRHHRANPAPAEPSAASHARVVAPRPPAAASNHAALFAETVWSLDRLSGAGAEMPEPKGIYHLDDVLALVLVGPVWQELRDRFDPLFPDPVRREARAAVCTRSRYAEDRLAAGAFTQYVILGAGLDSFAWRRPDLLGSLTVFEV